MRKRYLREDGTQMRHSLVLIFVVLCMGVVPASAQMSLIKGSPFEAIKTRTVNLPGDSFSVSGRVARSSNSSTYEEMPNAKTGEIEMIHILDAPGRRTIFLDLKRKVYWVQPASFSEIGNLQSKEASQKYIEFLRTWKGDHSSENGVETERTPLGFRMQDGFLEFGVRTVINHMPSSWSLKEKVWEDWTIPALAISVEKVGFDSNNKPDQITRYSNIRTTEPDPDLFEIPPGYSPAPVQFSK
jgi:hypothetical protein